MLYALAYMLLETTPSFIFNLKSINYLEIY